MITGQNIVCFANDWESDPTSKHQVMRLLARENKVLWVESIGLRRPGISGGDTSRIFKKLKKFLGGAVEVSRNMHVVTPVVIPYHEVKIIAKFNAWFLARYLKIHARRLGMSQFQLWTFMNK